jgi:hypothetical protein
MIEDAVTRLHRWATEMKAEELIALRKITELVTSRLDECLAIDDPDRAAEAAVNLLFLSNRLHHMFEIYLNDGSNDEDEEESDD